MEITWRYISTGSCGYYIIYLDGKFEESCDVGELHNEIRELERRLI